MNDTAIPEGFVPIDQEGTFLGPVGGLTWRCWQDRTDTCVRLAPTTSIPMARARGSLLTLLDITLGATVESLLGLHADRHPVTLQLSCSMLAPVRGRELLFGEAAVDRSTRTVTFVSARLDPEKQTALTASAVLRGGPHSGRERVVSYINPRRRPSRTRGRDLRRPAELQAWGPAFRRTS